MTPRHVQREPAEREPRMPRLTLAQLGILLAGIGLTQGALAIAPPVILPMRQRAEVVNDWLGRRLDTIVPELMREQEIDTWVIIGREYNEDPVLETMLPATWLSARRRTILVFHDHGPDRGVERLAVARYSVGDQFESAWDPQEQPDQWERLSEIIESFDSKRLALNTSTTFALADGLTQTQHRELIDALPEHLRERIVSAEPLAVGWLERRLPEEIGVYSSVVSIAQGIIAEALSEAVIQPGITTKQDLEWWCRERVRELRLTAWFQPTLYMQRHDGGTDFFDLTEEEDPVIRRGDLIRLDFGITYLRLSTDTQQMAYVLRRGETEPPAGLRDALRQGNRLQDILTDEFKAGRTGNQVLRAALEMAEDEGIDAMIYTHPIGFHGHGAGPSIGMWDNQEGVVGTGDYPIHDRTAYSIELNAAVRIPEWGGQRVRIMLEEDAFFQDNSVEYLAPRQTQLHMIR